MNCQEHQWEFQHEHSGFTVLRYRCAACGAAGWRRYYWCWRDRVRQLALTTMRVPSLPDAAPTALSWAYVYDAEGPTTDLPTLKDEPWWWRELERPAALKTPRHRHRERLPDVYQVMSGETLSEPCGRFDRPPDRWTEADACEAVAAGEAGW